MVGYDTETTAKLAKLVKTLVQLRQVRDFIKVEVTIGRGMDDYYWKATYRKVTAGIDATQVLIGDLLPSQHYEMVRDIPKP